MGVVHKLPGALRSRPPIARHSSGSMSVTAESEALCKETLGDFPLGRSQSMMFALFASCEELPGFTVELIPLAALKRTIEKLFCVTPGDHIGTHIVEEITEIEKMLRERGDCAFEDGWMALRTLPDAISFLMSKVNDAVEEARFADEKRAIEYRNAAAAEARYCHLAGALRRAFGIEFGQIMAEQK